MAKGKSGIPFKPLLDKWLKTGKTKAGLAKALGMDQANITNWISRGIPSKELARVVKLVGMDSDSYLVEVGWLEAPRMAKEPSAVYPVGQDHLEQIIKAWVHLEPTERAEFSQAIMAKAGYNAIMRNEFGRLPETAKDSRVADTYQTPTTHGHKKKP